MPECHPVIPVSHSPSSKVLNILSRCYSQQIIQVSIRIFDSGTPLVGKIGGLHYSNQREWWWLQLIRLRSLHRRENSSGQLVSGTVIIKHQHFGAQNDKAKTAISPKDGIRWGEVNTAFLCPRSRDWPTPEQEMENLSHIPWTFLLGGPGVEQSLATQGLYSEANC